jgi:hypothetical protein
MYIGWTTSSFNREPKTDFAILLTTPLSFPTQIASPKAHASNALL